MLIVEFIVTRPKAKMRIGGRRTVAAARMDGCMITVNVYVSTVMVDNRMLREKT